MKRTLPFSPEERPRKRQNTSPVNPFGDARSSIIKKDIAKDVVSNQPDLPRIPHEVVFTHIVPKYALTWLFVSKRCHKIAFAALPADPRLAATFSNVRDTFCQVCKEGNARVVQLMLTDPRVVPEEFASSLPCIANYNIAKLFAECDKTAFLLPRVFLWAVHQGHLDMIVQLMSSGRLDHRADLIEDAIAVSKHGYVIKYLLSLINVNEVCSRILSRAIRKTITDGNYSAFSELIRQIDPIWYTFVLRCASYMGQYEMVKLMLEYPQVDPNNKEERVIEYGDEDEYSLSSAIEEALIHRHFAIITLLMNDPRVKISKAIRQKYEHLLP